MTSLPIIKRWSFCTLIKTALSHLIKKSTSDLTKEELEEIDAVAAIDCTWHQANAMLREVPDNMVMIRLRDYKTTFWRYHHYDETCLATVESIYYFYQEFVEARKKKGLEAPSSESLHDLLFMYALQFHQIKMANASKEVVVA